jgi:hypothetical protein
MCLRLVVKCPRATTDYKTQQHSNAFSPQHKIMSRARGSLLLLGSMLLLLLAGLVAGSSSISLTINIVYPAGNLHPTDKLYLRYFTPLPRFCLCGKALVFMLL